MKQLTGLIKDKLLFYLLFLIVIFTLTFIAVRPSFHLALSGDDWLFHYVIWKDFEIIKGDYFNPLAYICTYCPHYLFHAVIKFFWGFNPFYYYLSSYFARIIGAVSVFLLIKSITRKYYLALLASILFSVNYIGIETTDWVFNMTHYLGVAVVCVFIINYWRTKNSNKVRDFALSALLFAVALIISPPRMHGLFPLVIVSELVLYLIYKNNYHFKLGILRLIIIFVTYAFIFSWLGKIVEFLLHIGLKFNPGGVINGYGTSQYNFQRVQEGISYIKKLLSSNQTDFFINPFATLGNYIIPDKLLFSLPFFNTAGFGIFIWMVWTFITTFIIKLFNPKKKQITYYIVALSCWTAFIYILKFANLDTFISTKITFSLVGGFSTIFTILIFFLIKKELPIFAYMFALSFSWMNTFYLFPQLLEPSVYMFSWSRYAVQAAAGLSIWVALLIYLVVIKLKEKKLYSWLGIPYIFAFLFFILHLIFTNDYLNHVGTYRSVELDKRLWGQITTFVPKITQNSQSIFFLASQPTVYETAEKGIRFAFSARSAIFYDIKDQNISPSMIVNNYPLLLSTIYKESSSLNDIYGLYLDENQQLLNITDQIRQKLKEDLGSLKKGTPILPQ